jgi:undecaprenyl-diphosphatase
MSTLLRYVEHSDFYILNVFNRSIKCKILDIFMPVVTYLGSTALMIFLCIYSILNSETKMHSFGIKCTTALITSNLISQIIKKCVSRIRPFLKFDNLNIKKIGIDKYSFPSGHTTAAFTAAVMLVLTFSHAYIFISVASLVGISRMYLGVHYPTDVMAGTIIGTMTSFVVYNLF